MFDPFALLCKKIQIALLYKPPRKTGIQMKRRECGEKKARRTVNSSSEPNLIQASQDIH